MSLWTRQYEPKTAQELLINKTKVLEIDGFLKESIYDLSCCIHKKRNILIILGPNGSGKTSALRCLCKSYNIDILEWEAPSGLKEGLGTSFYRFIIGSSLFSNSNSNRNNIILIKEFPFTLTQYNPQILSEIRQFLSRSDHGVNYKTPIIFISSESRNDRSFLKSILPGHFDNLEEYTIKTKKINNCRIKLIKLNPIPSTKIRSKLSFILNQKGLVISNKEESIIDSIVHSSDGDLCHAITQLQFYFGECTHDEVNGENMINNASVFELRATGNKRTKYFSNFFDQNNTSSNICAVGKEPMYNVFRTIGKILYNKREEFIPEMNVEERLNIFIKRSRIKKQLTNIKDENMESINHVNFIGIDKKKMYSYSRGFGDISDLFTVNLMQQEDIGNKGKLSFDLENLLLYSSADEEALTLLLQENYISFIGNSVDIIKCSEIFSWSDVVTNLNNKTIFDDYLPLLSLSCIARTILYFNSKPLNPCSSDHQMKDDKKIGFKLGASLNITNVSNCINNSFSTIVNLKQSKFRWHPKKPFHKVYLSDIKSIKDDFRVYINNCVSEIVCLRLVSYAYFSKILFTEVFPHLNYVFNISYNNFDHFKSRINKNLVCFIQNWGKYNKYIYSCKDLFCENPNSANCLATLNTENNLETVFGDYLSDEQLVSILETCDVESLDNKTPFDPLGPNGSKDNCVLMTLKDSVSSDDSIDDSLY